MKLNAAPNRNQVVDKTGKITPVWDRWLRDLHSRVQATMEVYRQDAEPTLNDPDSSCIWVDTDNENKTYLIFRRGVDDQLKVELT